MFPNPTFCCTGWRCSQAQEFTPRLSICLLSAVPKANRTVAAKHSQGSGCEAGMVLGKRCWMAIAGSSLSLRHKSKNQLQTHLLLTPSPCTSCLQGLTGSLPGRGFWRLPGHTRKGFRGTRQHQKYKDFMVITAHPKPWSRLETGFRGDKPLHPGTPALLPGFCSENVQNKTSAAITRANKNADKKLQTPPLMKKLSSKGPTLVGTAWSLFSNLFPKGKAETGPYLIPF